MASEAVLSTETGSKRKENLSVLLPEASHFQSKEAPHVFKFSQVNASSSLYIYRSINRGLESGSFWPERLGFHVNFSFNSNLKSLDKFLGILCSGLKCASYELSSQGLPLSEESQPFYVSSFLSLAVSYSHEDLEW